jgi:peptidoglycan hydrolase-like protein with peptidoglycan-binding domain
MDRRMPRDWRAGDNFRRETSRGRAQRPDRLALWAVLLAVFTLVVAAASAHAASGGVSSGGGTAAGSETTDPATGSAFGTRTLRVGMEGDDVEVLTGIVKSKSYSGGIRIDTYYDSRTAQAVKSFQGEAGLPTTGVVNESTSQALTRSMERAAATWYGPGFYGNRTACGKTLTTTTIGVAHRTLPCGTKVTFAYRGHYIVAPVIDRGPYSGGYTFDLTSATAEALGFDASGTLRYAVAQAGSDARGL